MHFGLLIEYTETYTTVKKNSCSSRPKILTKNIHEWGIGEADRAEIYWDKSCVLGETFQTQAGLPGATQAPPKSKFKIQAFMTNLNPSQTSATLLGQPENGRPGAGPD